jgi:hypothetical protein
MNLNVMGILLLCGCSCGQTSSRANPPTSNDIVWDCSETSCYGKYSGPEFKNGEDVAHQFSNKMALVVGDRLKELYKTENYTVVDLEHITMVTKDMDGVGDVEYTITIPFLRVQDSCDAFTSFDHRGGWGHTPKLETVLTHFSKVKGLQYYFHKTPEGLTEYWLQWRSASLQSKCDY